jgi:uncharacterized protein (TIGR00730 family)
MPDLVPPRRLKSVCVFCASSNGADPAYRRDAALLGEALAGAGIRLVYGGGDVGLMGACARAAHEAGGDVLGVIPDFLTDRERPYAEVRTVVVTSMHERKMMMFENADAFVVLPGGIGTLEEVIEILSWRRLALHAKPVVFYDPNGFWSALFQHFRRMTDEGLAPASFETNWAATTHIEAVIPALRAALPAGLDAAPGAADVT